MLECAGIILHVVVIIIGIRKEIPTSRKNISRRNIGRRQSKAVRALNFVHLTRIVIKIFTHFIAQIGIGILIADYLHRIVNAHCPVIGCQYYLIPLRRYQFKQIYNVGMAEPRLGD